MSPPLAADSTDIATTEEFARAGAGDGGGGIWGGLVGFGEEGKNLGQYFNGNQPQLIKKKLSINFNEFCKIFFFCNEIRNESW